MTKKNWGEDMRCAGCGYVFKPGEHPSQGANYGPGETQGPFYWCAKCCPPGDASSVIRSFDQFMKDCS